MRRHDDTDNPIPLHESDSDEEEVNMLSPGSLAAPATSKALPPGLKRRRVTSEEPDILFTGEKLSTVSGSGSQSKIGSISGADSAHAGPSGTHDEISGDQPGAEGSKKRPKVERKTAEDFLPDVFEILPGICIEWTLNTLRVEIKAGRTKHCVTRTIDLALEMVPSYPKARESNAMGKTKSTEEDTAEKYKSRTYRLPDRLQPDYRVAAMAELSRQFPKIPITQSVNLWVSQLRIDLLNQHSDHIHY